MDVWVVVSFAIHWMQLLWCVGNSSWKCASVRIHEGPTPDS